MFDAPVHADRRSRLAAALGDGIAIVATAPEVPRNRDTHYPYRHDSYFYWLTGFAEPEAVVVLVGGAEPQSILFCRDKDEKREIWDGFRHGPAGARAQFGFDDAHSITELDARLPELMGNRARLAYAVGQDPAWDARVIGWLNAVRAKTRQGIVAPGEIIDVRHALDEMRLIKDAHELALMRRAVGPERHPDPAAPKLDAISARLDATQREELSRDLFLGTLRRLRQVGGLAVTLVVSPDPAVLALAELEHVHFHCDNRGVVVRTFRQVGHGIIFIGVVHDHHQWF